MKICFLYIFSNNQWAKIDLIFLFDYNDIRAFQVFKWTAWCIFKCEKTKIKVVKNTYGAYSVPKPFEKIN